MKEQIKKDLITLFEHWSKEKAVNIEPLSKLESASYREYYRVTGKNKKAIGVFNADKKENIAFLSFTKHFIEKGICVPQIYAQDIKKNIYLIQDLGDATLFSYLTKIRKDKDFSYKLVALYKKIIEELVQFQIFASKDIDYSVCYPRSRFDKQSMMWDLNYFKYYFLKLAKIPFDEQDLEDDFNTFSDYLLQADCNFFMYRDFQSRNIMIYNNLPYFVDYQGGRKGALQYDLASLLFDAKADIPQNIREQLLKHYIKVVGKIIDINKNDFIQYFYAYALIRIMQALGAFGFRGLYEKKQHFLQSIPYAIKNIELIINKKPVNIKISALLDVLQQLTKSKFSENDKIRNL